MVFYRKHVCRMDPWPGSFVRTMEGLAANPEVYAFMNGPSEFHVIGTIKDWDITSQLSRIQAPTLIFCGEHDEVTPATAELAHRGITDPSSWSCRGARTCPRRSDPRRRSG